jgi:plastocyanin
MTRPGRLRIAGSALLLAAIATFALVACAPRLADRPPAPGSASMEARPTVAMPTGSAAATTAAGGEVFVVEMGDHWYIPALLTVPAGTTVEWRMTGTQEHDVWAHDGSFHSPTMGPGMRFSHTFTRAGNYKYLCLPHSGDGMFGEIVVVPRP